tara:strand:- start:479 stop:586 length:108 start_codon:yes stop_codon:yes gene_type:complete
VELEVVLVQTVEEAVVELEVIENLKHQMMFIPLVH